MKQCPYCNEPHHALKNHVRLSSGGGHGPSGQYPADFDQADETVASTDASGQEDPEPSETNAGPSEASMSPSEDPGGRQSGTVEMTPEEIDRVVDGAVDAGREQASTTATQSAQVVEQPATGESNDDAGEHPPEALEGCPECGGELVDFRGVTARATGGMKIPTPDDYYCSECRQGFNVD